MSKCFLIVLAILLTITTVTAYIPWFAGTVTTGVLYGSGPDCRKGGSSPSPFNPYAGEIINASLDPTNPNNAALITANGGNQFITATEFCISGELVDFACGDAYPSPINPTDIFAIQWTTSELSSYFGAATASTWTCVDFIADAAGTLGSQPGFYAPLPPFSYSYSNPNGPYIYGPIYGGSLSASATPGPLSGGIALINIIGPAPSQSVFATTNTCPPVTNTCYLTTAVTCPGTYWIQALDYQGAASIIATTC